mgnify:CR=1 FL=1
MSRLTVKIIVKCESLWVAEILKEKIAKIIEEVELAYNLPIGMISEVEVIE